MAGIVKHVTVVEFEPKLKADEVLQRKLNSLNNVTVITNAQTTEIFGDGNKITSLEYKDRVTGQSKQLPLAGVFIQIGLVPNTEFLKGTIELTRYGEIIVGPKGETSVAGIFAAGDVTDVAYKQIIIAMGTGATAALGAFDYLIRTPIQNNAKEENAA